MTKPKKKRNKPYKPRLVKGNMPIAASLIMNPIHKILDRITIDGTIDTIKGNPVVYDGDETYKVIPALGGLMNWIELYADKHNQPIDLSSLRQLNKNLYFDMPITEELLLKAKNTAVEVQKYIARMNDTEGLSNLTTVEIKNYMDNAYEDDRKFIQ
jgi:hypothetical protein